MAQDSTTIHTPVLLQETINGLAIQPGAIIVDGTVGGGGHSEEILKRWDGQIRLICLDADAAALARTRERLARFDQTKIIFIESNFRRLSAVLNDLEIRQIDALLLDLGLSSDELAAAGRGFSFQYPDEPLLMTYADPRTTPPLLTAQTILNVWSEETLSTIISSYGEERYARRIAAAIVAARERTPFERVGQLVEVVAAAVPRRHYYRLHPATKTFQALRIAVNDELGALQQTLEDGWSALAAGGHVAIISFHSLEDRIVKRFFRQEAKTGRATLVTKKPIIPTREETIANPRARSAKLRIIIKK